MLITGLKIKPFSTYPEDHERLLFLACSIEENLPDASEFLGREIRSQIYELADLVKAILKDEDALSKALDEKD